MPVVVFSDRADTGTGGMVRAPVFGSRPTSTQLGGVVLKSALGFDSFQTPRAVPEYRMSSVGSVRVRVSSASGTGRSDGVNPDRLARLPVSSVQSMVALPIRLLLLTVQKKLKLSPRKTSPALLRT